MSGGDDNIVNTESTITVEGTPGWRGCRTRRKDRAAAERNVIKPIAPRVICTGVDVGGVMAAWAIAASKRRAYRSTLWSALRRALLRKAGYGSSPRRPRHPRALLDVAWGGPRLWITSESTEHLQAGALGGIETGATAFMW